MASYKKPEGFQCGFQRSSHATYEFAYQIAIRCFKAMHPKLEVDEDPKMGLPSDAKMPTPMKAPFGDRMASPLA
ncbi:hypothetical protein GW17_00038462 [Ensete ventricosum]|uniref:Uncharacterized protein n=1 Tax=Ensete ventricosum TaxID=4639 RepID=A0A444DKN6_ENSVE|nr:hypothetical protein B296_00022484 [Ensete ventricosum]RWV98670.1 hypothetical protein GW17_00038462 [Ensete ventricosum]